MSHLNIFVIIASILALSSCQPTTSELPPNSSSSSSSSSSSTPISSSPTIDSSSSSSSVTNKGELTFFSVNDVHGSLEPSETNTKKFGMSRIATAVEEERKRIGDDNVVLLSAGDMSQGSAISNISEGRAMIETMSAMKFDAMAIGNHEFDWGIPKLEAMNKFATFPFLGLNITEKSTQKTPDSFVDTSVIINKGGIKIGLIGTISSTAEGSIKANIIEPYNFSSYAPLVKAESKKLRDVDKCDMVALITHEGGGQDINELANSSFGDVPVVDAVFSGHSHQKESFLINNIPVVQAGGNGQAYTKVTFKHDGHKYKLLENKVIESNDTTFKSLTPNITVDSIIAKYKKENEPIINKVVGTLDEKMSRYDNSKNIGKLVTDMMLSEIKKDPLYKDVRCSYHNYGGIRADLDAGEITIGDIYSVSPFDNELYISEFTGTKLIDAFQGTDDFNSGIYQKGSNYYFNDNDEPVLTSTKYKLVIIDYVSLDNSSYNKLYDPNPTMTGYLIRDTVIAGITAKGNIVASDYNFTKLL